MKILTLDNTSYNINKKIIHFTKDIALSKNNLYTLQKL